MTSKLLPDAGAGPARYKADVRHAAGGGILFASELKAIVAAVGPELSIDSDGLVASTLFYFLPEERSAIKGSLQASTGLLGRVAS